MQRSPLLVTADGSSNALENFSENQGRLEYSAQTCSNMHIHHRSSDLGLRKYLLVGCNHSMTAVMQELQAKHPGGDGDG